MPTPQRISALDGLRGIAILSVVAFHYFWRWINEGYQVQNTLLSPVFHYGYMGVELFFIISGYVIFMTLENCKNVGEFLLRRWIRLWPAMFFGSLLIFAMAFLIPGYPFTKEPIDLLPGLAFISPVELHDIFGLQTHHLDGAFWSMFVEVKFYLLAGLLYFTVQRWTAAILVSLVAIRLLLLYSLRIDTAFMPTTAQTWDAVLVLKSLPWFCIGIIVYQLQKKQSVLFNTFLLFFALAETVETPAYEESALVRLVVCGIFLLPFVNKAFERLLSWRGLVFVGLISYPLYLIHENIGVATMQWVKGFAPVWVSQWIGLPLAVVMIGAAYLIWQHLEKPAQAWLKGKLLRKKEPTMTVLPAAKEPNPKDKVFQA